MRIVETAIANARLTISVLIFLMLAGAMAYISIPKEAEPDIQIPILYVSLHYSGISPEDSERLLLRPMETALKAITGIKKMTSTAYQSGGNVLIEFQAGADLAKALEDVRNKVAQASAELPDGADEPTVNEVNLSEFPILVITLSGDVPERALARVGRELRDKIEEQPEVLNADLQGVREDLVEVVIDPGKLASYGLRPDILLAGFAAGNQLVAAGALEGEMGRYAIKVPSLLETVSDVANLPVISTETATVRVRDIADIFPTLKEPVSITRLNGAPAVAIEVSKRSGANLIETVDEVKRVTEEFKALLPEGTVVGFSQDKSKDIRQLLSDLRNSVLCVSVDASVLLTHQMWTAFRVAINRLLPGVLVPKLKLSVSDFATIRQHARSYFVLAWSKFLRDRRPLPFVSLGQPIVAYDSRYVAKEGPCRTLTTISSRGAAWPDSALVQIGDACSPTTLTRRKRPATAPTITAAKNFC